MGKNKKKRKRHKTPGSPIRQSRGSQYARWRMTSPEKVNNVAKELFGGRYYCVGDRKQQ